MFAALFFLTFYLQNVQHYSPVRTGLVFLPLTVGLMALRTHPASPAPAGVHGFTTASLAAAAFLCLAALTVFLLTGRRGSR